MSERAPSKQTLLLCVASATVAAAALWLVWPRHPKASREALLSSLRRLREECAAIYADAGASVERSGARKHLTASSLSSLASVLAAAGKGTQGADNVSTDGAGAEEEDDSHKLKQVLEQPLVLEAALREANARVAAELFPGGTAEDLEAELQRNGEDEEVRKSMEVIAEMHQACLLGERAAASEVKAARDVWSQDETLDMLRRLGEAKAARLEALRLALDDQECAGAIPDLGAKSIQACVNAEEDVWQLGIMTEKEKEEQKSGAVDNLASRRCLFGLALESYSEDRSFRNRRVAVESELGKAAAAASSSLVPLGNPLATDLLVGLTTRTNLSGEQIKCGLMSISGVKR